MAQEQIEELEKALVAQRAELEAAEAIRVERERSDEAFARVTDRENVTFQNAARMDGIGVIDTRVTAGSATGAEDNVIFETGDVKASGLTIRVGQQDRVVLDAGGISDGRTVTFEQGGEGKVGIAIPEGSTFDVQYDEKTKRAVVTVEQDGKSKQINVEGVTPKELEFARLSKDGKSVSGFVTLEQIQAQQSKDLEAAGKGKADKVSAARDSVTKATSALEARRVADAGPRAEATRGDVSVEDALKNVTAGQASVVSTDSGMGNIEAISREIKAKGDDSTKFVVVHEDGRDVIVTGNTKDGKFEVTAAYELVDGGLSQAESKFRAGTKIEMAGTEVLADRVPGAPPAPMSAAAAPSVKPPEGKDTETEEWKAAAPTPVAVDARAEAFVKAVTEYEKATGIASTNIEDEKKFPAGSYPPAVVDALTQEWNERTQAVGDYKKAFAEKMREEGKDPEAQWKAAAATPGSDVEQIVNGKLTSGEINAKVAELGEEARTSLIPKHKDAEAAYITALNAFENAVGTSPAEIEKLKAADLSKYSAAELDTMARDWEKHTKAVGDYKKAFEDHARQEGKDPEAEWKKATNDPKSFEGKLAAGPGIGSLDNIEAATARLNDLTKVKSVLADAKMRSGARGEYVAAQEKFAREVLDIKDAGKINDFVREQVAKVEKGNPSAASNANSAEWTAKANETNKKTQLFTQEYLPAYKKQDDLHGHGGDELKNARETFTNGTVVEAETKAKYEQGRARDAASYDARLKAAHRILRPAVEESLRANGVPENQVPERTAAMLKDMERDIIYNWDTKQGVNGWPTEHAAAINKETTALLEARRELTQEIGEYGRTVGMPFDKIKELQDHYEKECNGKGTSKEKIDYLREKLEAWKESTQHAKEYREAFNEVAMRSEVNPATEWQLRANTPGTDIYKLVSGSLKVGDIKEMAKIERSRADREGAQTREDFILERGEKVTPSGAPTIGGVLAIAPDGTRSVARVENGIATGKDGKPLQVGSLIVTQHGREVFGRVHTTTYKVVDASGKVDLQVPYTPGDREASHGTGVGR